MTIVVAHSLTLVMDTEYLKAAVGNALSTGIAETVLMRPEDPVDYLAQRLLKFVEDSHTKTATIAEEEAAKDKQVRKADVAAVAQREAEKTTKDTAAKVQKEDDRLSKLLDAASSSAEERSEPPCSTAPSASPSPPSSPDLSPCPHAFPPCVPSRPPSASPCRTPHPRPNPHRCSTRPWSFCEAGLAPPSTWR